MGNCIGSCANISNETECSTGGAPGALRPSSSLDSSSTGYGSVGTASTSSGENASDPWEPGSVTANELLANSNGCSTDLLSETESTVTSSQDPAQLPEEVLHK